MQIEVYADVVCPWCYIGTRRLARALAQRPNITVERYWRPYQLQPAMPKTGQPWNVFVREKFGGLERAQPMFARVTEIGAADDITFDFDRHGPTANTRDAHQLILLAAEHDLEWALAEALFAADFTHGQNLGDRAMLTTIATNVGLPEDEVRDALANDAYGPLVDASQETARRLGIQGVPFYVINGRYGISGAQPIEVLLDVIDTYADEVAAK